MTSASSASRLVVPTSAARDNSLVHPAQLNPLETIEVPVREGEPNRCVILDAYRKPGVDFVIGSHRHGLLLVIEVFRSEMAYAMKHGSQSLLNKLREKGYYPYSDLDREPVI